MFNVSQLYSIPPFLRVNFQEVNYDEQAFITMKDKKEIVDSSITFPAGYYRKNINIFNEKLSNGLHFAVMRQRISSYPLNIVNEKLTQTLAKNCFCSLQYDIENFIFTSSYRLRKFHIYTRIRICGKMLLSCIFA